MSNGPRATIRPARRFYPVRERREVSHKCQNDRFVILCLSGVFFFQSLKYAKTRFLPVLHRGPRWGSLRRSPRPASWLERGTPPPCSLPPPRLRRHDLAPTSLKFVHLALRSKMLDTPVINGFNGKCPVPTTCGCVRSAAAHYISGR